MYSLCMYICRSFFLSKFLLVFLCSIYSEINKLYFCFLLLVIRITSNNALDTRRISYLFRSDLFSSILARCNMSTGNGRGIGSGNGHGNVTERGSGAGSGSANVRGNSLQVYEFSEVLDRQSQLNGHVQRRRKAKQTEPYKVTSCEQSVQTDAGLLGDCEPGTSILLDCVVWHDHAHGVYFAQFFQLQLFF